MAVGRFETLATSQHFAELDVNVRPETLLQPDKVGIFTTDTGMKVSNCATSNFSCCVECLLKASMIVLSGIGYL